MAGVSCIRPVHAQIDIKRRHWIGRPLRLIPLSAQWWTNMLVGLLLKKRRSIYRTIFTCREVSVSRTGAFEAPFRDR
jgi:hypothetical protein